MHRLFAVLALCFGVFVASPAAAQSDLDLDGASDERDSSAKKRKKLADVVVREVERGVYIKANIGSTIFIGPRSGLLQPGTTLMLAVGQDVLDKPKASVAWELTFDQSIHNATFGDYNDIAGLDRSLLVQGDVHVFNVFAGVEGSYYPLRRLGIGARAGGGVAFVPLLMNRQFYESDVVPAWGGIGAKPGIHEGVLGGFYVGPTLEYYTKLSHFSLGIEANFKWIFGLDYGVDVSGFLKYTF